MEHNEKCQMNCVITFFDRETGAIGGQFLECNLDKDHEGLHRHQYNGFTEYFDDMGKLKE